MTLQSHAAEAIKVSDTDESMQDAARRYSAISAGRDRAVSDEGSRPFVAVRPGLQALLLI
jgi:hypothetical protein